MKKFISDIIGNQCFSWSGGSQIIVASQTGSGKSTFVFDKLLRLAAERNKYLVYFCNRRTLENQMKRTAGLYPYVITDAEVELSMHEQSHLLIVTYQHCEKNKLFPDIKIHPDEQAYSKEERYKMEELGLWNPRVITKEEILYYVFDEAHYFISDSLFNSGTNYWIPDSLCQEGCVSVFLTATPEPLYCYLAENQMRDVFKENEDEEITIPQLYKLYREARSVFNGIDSPYKMEMVLGFAREIYDERKAMKKNLERPTNLTEYDTISKILKFPDMGLNSLPLKFVSEKNIKKILRGYYPFEYGFIFIQEVLKDFYDEKKRFLLEKTTVYDCKADYSYIDPIYFEQYEELLDEIIESQDKWLIFVDHEKKGLELSSYLNERNCSAVFISAKRRNHVRSGAKKTFETISETGKFESKVLIATSVLDCGISLKDPKLTNIVIGQPDKTEFIQMIGRKRVSDGERVNLYIKVFTPKEINSLRMSMEQNLLFIMKFHFLSCEKLFPSDKASKRNVVEESFRGGISSLIYVKDPLPRKKRKGYLMEYSVSKTAYIQSLYALKIYTDAMIYFNIYQDYNFFLREQLNWIEKRYDVTCWYKYEERVNSFKEYLESVSGREWMDVDEQNEFCDKCMEFILKMPVALLSKEMRTFRTRYKRIMLSNQAEKKSENSIEETGDVPSKQRKKKASATRPGKSSLNSFFAKSGLPYRIQAKQFFRNERMWFWKLTKQETSEPNYDYNPLGIHIAKKEEK